MDDLISRQAAIKAICEDGTMLERQGKYTMTMAERKQRDVDILDTLPPAQLAQDLPNGCTDTISRAAVGDALNRIEISRNASWYEFYQKALTAVGTLPSAQPGEDIRAMCGECDAWNQYKNYPQPGWIPCSERCPEYRIYVLVTYKPVYGLPDIGITYYNGNKWDAPKDGTPRKVIAWMPLPKPWEGKEQ